MTDNSSSTSTPDDVRILRDGFTHRWVPSDSSDPTGFGALTGVDPDAQESIIPFRKLCNPAPSWRDYHLGVYFPSTDYQFSVVTSYFINERDTASQNDSVTAYTRELFRADQAYGPGASAALQRDLTSFGLTAPTFLHDLPAVLATLPCYFVYV